MRFGMLIDGEFVTETAREAGLDDYQVQVNVGPTAGQTIFHLHWHVLGGGRPRPSGMWGQAESGAEKT